MVAGRRLLEHRLRGRPILRHAVTLQKRHAEEKLASRFPGFAGQAIPPRRLGGITIDGKTLRIDLGDQRHGGPVVRVGLDARHGLLERRREIAALESAEGQVRRRSHDPVRRGNATEGGRGLRLRCRSEDQGRADEQGHEVRETPHQTRSTCRARKVS